MPRFYHIHNQISNAKMIDQRKINTFDLNHLSFFKHHEHFYEEAFLNNPRIIVDAQKKENQDEVIDLMWEGNTLFNQQTPFQITNTNDQCFKNHFNIFIDSRMYHLDPHSIKEPNDDCLFDQQVMDIFLEHRGFHVFLKKCINQYSKDQLRAINGISLVEHLEVLKNQQKVNPNRIVFLPLTFWNDCYKNVDVLNNDFSNRIHILDFPHVLSKKYFALECDLLAENKPLDVFVSGTKIDWIYPFRTITFDRICSSTKFSVLDYNPYFQKMKEILKDTLDEFQNANEFQRKMICYKASFTIDSYYENYYRHIRNCKIAIVGNNVFGYMARRYFEYMSNGCVCVGQMPKYADQYGLKHMVNFYECEADDVENAIEYLLSNDNIRLMLATNARKLMLERYTTEFLIDKMLDDIDRIVDKYQK